MTRHRGKSGVGVRSGAGILATLLAWLPAAEPAELPELPQPLTLEQALALADADHPDLDLAQADLERARSRRLEVESFTGTRAWLDLTPERVVPSTTGGDFIDDSRARILISKPLYDFGRSRALEDAAVQEVAAREDALIDVRSRRRIEIMARFFDVLSADLRYAVDNEEMAHKYVLYDRVRERAALGQVSEVDLLEAENRYREALITRTESQKRQSSARQKLAIALNRPGQLPGELVQPPPAVERPIPEYRELVREVLERNPTIAALRRDAAAARSSLEAERARRRPVLSGEIEAADYERSLAARSDRRVMLNLRVPLYQGGEVDAALSRAAAEQGVREARLRRAEHELHQAVLDAIQELETLKIRRQAAVQRTAFRDLYLDRQRALYEMEMQVSLGDAMVKLTEAQWQAARVEFDLALAWARLDALTGVLPSLNKTKESKP
jgi:outer membrane protein TolC